MSDILEVTRGDTEFLDITATEPDGSPVNLSGSDVWWTAKRRATDPDTAAIFQKTVSGGGIEVTDALNGLATVSIDFDDWPPVVGVPLRWDVQAVTPGAPGAPDQVVTLAGGTLVVVQDVTFSTEVTP